MRPASCIGSEARMRPSASITALIPVGVARMTGSPVLARYVSEVSSRCGLILALYSRPHSSDCAVNEHRQLIAALSAGDAQRASTLMEEHLEAVANRALIVARPARGRDLKDVLTVYAEDAKRSTREEKQRRR